MRTELTDKKKELDSVAKAVQEKIQTVDGSSNINVSTINHLEEKCRKLEAQLLTQKSLAQKKQTEMRSQIEYL